MTSRLMPLKWTIETSTRSAFIPHHGPISGSPVRNGTVSDRRASRPAGGRSLLALPPLGESSTAPARSLQGWLFGTARGRPHSAAAGGPHLVPIGRGFASLTAVHRESP
jgi:hypothetical protein